MIPAIGDTLDGRYSLVAQYRTQPGLSAWIAHDHALDMDCQVFLLTDETRIGPVSQNASALVLSRNPRSTIVRRFHSVGDALLVVMEPDPGVALSALIDSGKPLSFAAMRMVVNELIDSIQSLHASQVDFRTLVPEVVRVAPSSLTLADVPLDAYIAPPKVTQSRQTTTSNEMLSILQIAAILFKMLTRVDFDPRNMEEMNAELLKARQNAELRGTDLPTDFLTILERTLGVTLNAQESDRRPFPIYTLMEMQALLDDPHRPKNLTASELPLPKEAGAASISLVRLHSSTQQDLVDVPDSLVSTDTVHNEAGVIQPWSRHELFADTHVQEVDPSAAGLLDSDMPAPISAPFSAEWDQSQNHSQQASSASFGNDSQAPEASQAARSSQALPEAGAAAASMTGADGSTGMNAEKATMTDSSSRTASMSPQQAYISEAINEEEAEETSHTQTVVNHHEVSAADGEKLEEHVEHEQQKKENPHRFAQSIIIAILAIAVAIGAVFAGIELQKTFQIQMPWSRQENDADIGKHWNIDDSKAPLPGNAKEEAQEQSADNTNTSSSDGTGSSSSSASTSGKSSSASTKDRSRATLRRNRKGVIIEDKNASSVPKPVQQVTNPIRLPFTQRFFSTTAGHGIVITFPRTYKVTQVSVTLRGGTSGGTGKLYLNGTATDPQHGSPAATFTFSSNGQATTVKVPGNPSAQSLVIWMDQTSQGGMYYSNLSVMGGE